MMIKAGNRKTAEALAKEEGLRFIGWPIFGSGWYAASTAKALTDIGCLANEIIDLEAPQPVGGLPDPDE